MSPVRSVTYVSGPDPGDSGAGDGNRTHVRSLGSFYTAIVRRPLVVSDCTQESIFRTAISIFDAPPLWTKLYGDSKQACNSYRTPGRHAGGLRKSSTPSLLSKP